jgi:predicted transcriptional regulator YheO
MNRKNTIIYIMIGFLVSILIGSRWVNADDQTIPLIGKSLAAFDFYPIEQDGHGRLFLSKDKINRAIQSLDPTKESRASGELIWLLEKNSGSFLIDPKNNEKASLLKKKVYHPQNSKLLIETLKNIVHGVGQTFSGTPIEIVLHDTRNPLKSVIAIENPVTGRNLYDQTTNFGIELIKKYAKNEIKNESIISYPITLDDGRIIKATTIPIYDNNNDLVAFICINIDTSKIDGSDINALNTVTDALIKISKSDNYSGIKEIIKPLTTEKIFMKTNNLKYDLKYPLLVINEKNGFLACAYVNPNTCDKTGEACAIVSGVNSHEDMMEAKIIAVSEKAHEMGVNIGDLGKTALQKFQ